MATVWQTITGNSSLPVQAGNTLFDHLNSQQGGGGTLQIFAELEVELMPDLEVELEAEMTAELEPELTVELEPELEVEVC